MCPDFTVFPHWRFGCIKFCMCTGRALHAIIMHCTCCFNTAVEINNEFDLDLTHIRENYVIMIINNDLPHANFKIW